VSMPFEETVREEEITPRLSVALGAVKDVVMFAVSSVGKLRTEGQKTRGDSVSETVTENEHVAEFPPTSDAVHETAVVPTVKRRVPSLEGVHTIEGVTSTLSLAVTPYEATRE